MSLDEKQFQSLSRCEAISIASNVESSLEASFNHGRACAIAETYADVNRHLVEAGYRLKFEYDVSGIYEVLNTFKLEEDE